MAFFPTLNDGVFTAIRQIQRLVAADPNYFKADDCTYPPDFIKLFSPIAAVASVPLADIELGDFEVEAEELLKYVKGLKPTGDVAKDGIDYTRAMTSLLEKLLSIKERAAKLKDVAEFEAKVVEFLQDILTPEQRTLFMDRVQNG